jgi:hypothetical protein
MRWDLRVACALTSVLSLGGCAHAVDESIGGTTVCEIRRQGDRNIGAVVRLKGVYHATLDHGGSVSDPGCPNKPLIDMTPNSAASQDTSVSEFYEALPGVFDAGPPHFEYWVDVTGRIVSTRDVPAPLGVDRSRAPLGIELQTVWSYEAR